MLALLGLELAIPDRTTPSRRGRAFAGRQHWVVRHDEPMHLVLDSAGLQLFGQGGWDVQRHRRTRRQRRKLHIAVYADTGKIVAHVLTRGNADDAAQVQACSGR